MCTLVRGGGGSGKITKSHYDVGTLGYNAQGGARGKGKRRAPSWWDAGKGARLVAGS